MDRELIKFKRGRMLWTVEQEFRERKRNGFFSWRARSGFRSFCCFILETVDWNDRSLRNSRHVATRTAGERTPLWKTLWTKVERERHNHWENKDESRKKMRITTGPFTDFDWIHIRRHATVFEQWYIYNRKTQWLICDGVRLHDSEWRKKYCIHRWDYR